MPRFVMVQARVVRSSNTQAKCERAGQPRGPVSDGWSEPTAARGNEAFWRTGRIANRMHCQGFLGCHGSTSDAKKLSWSFPAVLCQDCSWRPMRLGTIRYPLAGKLVSSTHDQDTARCERSADWSFWWLGRLHCTRPGRRWRECSVDGMPGKELPELANQVSGYGVRSAYLVADVRSPEAREQLLFWAQKTFGAVDILINNAGVEYTGLYHELTTSQIQDVLDVNLQAPMMLTHALLKGMVERGTGHIVNMSSLAGRVGPACQEPYAATKAALVAFTYALRASYRQHGVMVLWWSALALSRQASIHASKLYPEGCFSPTGCCASRKRWPRRSFVS